MKTLQSIIFTSIVSICTGIAASNNIAQASTANTNSEVILVSEVEWEMLNPARGDKSPRAATIWGDRKGTVATGFLVKFVDGFSSPPHIHNVSYRGVVISGLIHNDDPYAAGMWMPTGSFWTQPKGEIHITAAKGDTNVAYIEIEKSPYLVWPKEKAFDSKERPVNVDASNIVWLDASIIRGQSETLANNVKVAYLWGVPKGDQLYGTLIKLPAGFAGKIHSHGSTFRAVVIQGQPQYQISDTDIKTLEAGSYFSSKGAFLHPISSNKEESMIYVRTDGQFEVHSVSATK